MARHSHWHQIRLKKGKTDRKRGKLFTKHARLIEIAARNAGGDVNMNASLRIAVVAARADNLPRENIDRAIKKGTGDLKGATAMEEITYEGYGPGGVALIIETLTDNKNRTGQFVRTILEKYGGNLGGSGSTSFMFEKKGMIVVDSRGDTDADELEIIDAGAQDLEAEKTDEQAGSVSTKFVVYTVSSELAQVKKALADRGFTVESAELVHVPKNTVAITDAGVAQKILGLIDALEDEDDISNVATNAEIANEAVN